MKKIVLSTILFLLLFAGTKVQAQDPSFRLGLKFSPHVGWFRPETQGYNSEGVNLGFTYGLQTEFLLSEFYSFDTGLQIMHFGGKLSYSERKDDFVDDENNSFIINGTTEQNYRLQNIEIPLTLKMKTREIGYNTFYARFGFGASLNMRAKGDKYFTGGSNSQYTLTQENIDIKDEIPFFRVSMIIGMGIEHSIGGNTALVAGFAFNNGFTNILKGNTKEVENSLVSQNARANFVELSLGILF